MSEQQTRRECSRCKQWTTYGTGCIGRCVDSDWRGIGHRDPLHDWHDVPHDPQRMVRPAMPPTLTREEARARLQALGQSARSADALLSTARMAVDQNADDDGQCMTILRAYVAHLDAQPGVRSLGGTIAHAVLNGEDAVAAVRDASSPACPSVDETLTRLRACVAIAADGCEETWRVNLRAAFRAHADAIAQAQAAERAVDASRPADELDEGVSYAWAAQALRPLEGLCEPHRLQQAADKVASAVREAWAHRGRTTLDGAAYPQESPPRAPLDVLSAAAHLVRALPVQWSAFDPPRIELGAFDAAYAVVAGLPGVRVRVQPRIGAEPAAPMTIEAAALMVDGLEVRAQRTRPSTPEEVARFASEDDT